MIRMDIKRTEFYEELSIPDRDKFFNLSAHKFLPSIDNIYYSLFIEGDYTGNYNLINFFNHLQDLKQQAQAEYTPQPYNDTLNLELYGIENFKYCLSAPDLYDIFITDFLPNSSNPRIQIQIRAFGLWTYGVEKMLKDSYNSIKTILQPLGCNINLSKENRIDYCWHTNEIQNPDKYLAVARLEKEMKTTMKRYKRVGRLEVLDGKTKMKADYLFLGNRKSNNVVVRIYNKALEVVEEGYKSFFLQLWYEQGLISFYDKYCLEKAYLKKKWSYIERAKLEFYIEHGNNQARKSIISRLLEDEKSTYEDIQSICNKLMPDITTVLNIEYETKRKFYYYSDDFIDSLKTIDRPELPEVLERMFRIVDNKKIFLGYLTSKTLSFEKNQNYVSWWKRLRNTKLDGLKTDQELLRIYSNNLDDQMIKAKFINTIATYGAYSQNLSSTPEQDMMDMLSNINDNDKMKIDLYHKTKQKKFQKIKNRIKKDQSQNQ